MNKLNHSIHGVLLAGFVTHALIARVTRDSTAVKDDSNVRSI
jgi:hypothetical protein